MASKAWEVITEVTFYGNERSAADTLELIDKLNAQGLIRTIERFTDEDYSFFPVDEQEERFIINQASEQMYLFHSLDEEEIIKNLKLYEGNTAERDILKKAAAYFAKQSQ